MRRIRKNKVVGEIMGGLGNQLFIIFTTYSHALDNDSEAYIKLIERKRKSYFDTPLYKNIKRTNGSLRVLREKSHSFTKLPPVTNITLYGYFQSWKYFHHNSQKIIEELGFNDLRKEILKKYQNYLDCDISLHFRIGDYKNIQHCHPVCDIEYYKKALCNFEESSKVLYFFEEADRGEVEKKVEELKENFPKMEFIGIDTNIVDYEQVFIMSGFKNFIIANSTFSWWGAYFSDIKDKRVFYPSKWFGPSLKKHIVDDLFFEDWIKIK